MYVNALVDTAQVEIHTEKGETEVGESTQWIGERDVGTLNCWGLQLGPGG
jgi:hypothetical protein